jgi:hypothetical protein
MIDACRRAVSGHAAAAPPSSVMNSRRLHFRGHSMTSSARASSLSGIVKPSAFAVLKSSRQLGDELMPF